MDNLEIKSKIISRIHFLISDYDVNINETTNLNDDLSMDSLDILELSLYLESDFNVHITNKESDKIQTFSDISKLIISKLFPNTRMST